MKPLIVFIESGNLFGPANVEYIRYDGFQGRFLSSENKHTYKDSLTRSAFLDCANGLLAQQENTFKHTSYNEETKRNLEEIKRHLVSLNKLRTVEELKIFWPRKLSKLFKAIAPHQGSRFHRNYMEKVNTLDFFSQSKGVEKLKKELV